MYIPSKTACQFQRLLQVSAIHHSLMHNNGKIVPVNQVSPVSQIGGQQEEKMTRGLQHLLS